MLQLARRQNLEPGDTRGWEQITIRDVIKEADISIGTFYKYFKDRADLAQYLWSEPVDGLRSKMQFDFDRATDPVDKIRALLEHYVQFSIENRRVFKGAFLFVPPDGRKQTQSVKLKDEIFYQNLCAAFLEGQKSGVFRSFDIHEMAQIFWAGIHGCLALPINLERYDFDQPDMLSSSMINSLLFLITARTG